MAGSMSIGGLVSGLKTDEIVSKVMELARRPQQRLQNEKAVAQQRLAVWQDLNTRMLALKMRSDYIADASAFRAKQVTSSDSSIVSASATHEAAAGIYSLKVTQKAQSHQLASQTYTSPTASIGTGTVSVSFANGEHFDVKIDSANNTLTGLRDAINRQDKGVQAVIVNSGTSTSPQYQLLLTSKNSGTDYKMTVTTTGLEGGTAPDITNEVQAATDAIIQLGEGAGKITVTKSSNTITDLIPGITLNVSGADAEKTIRIDVARNTSNIRSAIEGFVGQYNDLVDAIDKQFAYDSQIGQGGPLFGNSQLQSIQMDLVSAVTTPVVGITSRFRTLSSVGITLDMGGHLKIDNAELSRALDENAEDVTKLFSATLESNSSYVSMVSSLGSTRPSGTDGWNVVVTQAARPAQVTAGQAMNNPLGADETLLIGAKEIKLKEGITLEAVLAEINHYSAQTGVKALATSADGTGSGSYLTLRSTQSGSKQTFIARSYTSLDEPNSTGLGMEEVKPSEAAGESGAGVGLLGLDVEGTINGQAATGSGQILTAAPENKNSPISGLTLLITADAPLSTNVRFTKGIGTTIRDLLVEMTSSSGVVTNAETSINSEISDIDKDIVEIEGRLLSQQDRIYAQFNAMESQLAKLQDQGNYLMSMLGKSSSSK